MCRGTFGNPMFSVPYDVHNNMGYITRQVRICLYCGFRDLRIIYAPLNIVRTNPWKSSNSMRYSNYICIQYFELFSVKCSLVVMLWLNCRTQPELFTSKYHTRRYAVPHCVPYMACLNCSHS